MKMRCLHLLLSVLLPASVCAAEKPVQLPPVQVKENPFGSLGISALARSTFWSAFSKDEKIKSMIVTEVAAGSVADQRGLRAGDQVISIDGTAIQELSVRNVGELWYQKEIGELVRFEILRGEAKERKFFDLPIVKKPENSRQKR